MSSISSALDIFVIHGRDHLTWLPRVTAYGEKSLNCRIDMCPPQHWLGQLGEQVAIIVIAPADCYGQRHLLLCYCIAGRAHKSFPKFNFLNTDGTKQFPSPLLWLLGATASRSHEQVVLERAPKCSCTTIGAAEYGLPVTSTQPSIHSSISPETVNSPVRCSCYFIEGILNLDG